MTIEAILRGIRLLDPVTWSELERLRAADSDSFEKVVWTFIETVDCQSSTDVPPHLLAMAYESLGAKRVEEAIFQKWLTMNQLGRRNVCYGASIPQALGTGLALSLFFSPCSSVEDRHLIAAGLVYSCVDRGISDILMALVSRIGTYSSAAQQAILEGFINDAKRLCRAK